MSEKKNWTYYSIVPKVLNKIHKKAITDQLGTIQNFDTIQILKI